MISQGQQSNMVSEASHVPPLLLDTQARAIFWPPMTSWTMKTQSFPSRAGTTTAEESNDGLNRLLEIMESAKEAGSPLFLLPGDDTIH